MHLTSIAIECSVVDPDADGFPGFCCYLFAFLAYHFEIGNVRLRMVIRLIVDISCTSCMTTLFLYSIFLASTGFIDAGLITDLLRVGPFVDYVLLKM